MTVYLLNTGILGLGFDTISVNRIIPPFYNLLSQTKMNEQLFAVWLGKGSAAGGALTIGWVDRNRYSGDLIYSPVVRKGYWEVELEGFTLDGADIGVKSNRAAIDTGTSLIAVNQDEAKLINEKLGATSNGNGQYIFDCKKLKSLPNMAFRFSGKDLVLTSDQYVLVVPSPLGTQCVSGFMGIDFPPQMRNLWVVGDVFLRAYYTVYDLGNNRVGFGKSL